ncbi:MAG: hypothetical protein WAV27_18305 [Xanthobacteraceae bacterium]
MSGYYDANDPNRRNSPYDLNTGRDGGAWAWIAGAALVVILLALAFGMNHVKQNGTNVASNNQPAMSRSAAPPAGPASPAFTPAPMNPAPAKP